MAGQAAPVVTSTALLLGFEDATIEYTMGLCIDCDGDLYFTRPDRHCVYKVHRRRGRCSRPAVLSGSADVSGLNDGAAADARFRSPGALCISPGDPDTLLVMDGRESLRAVDIVTGATRTRMLHVVGLPRCLDTWASDGRHHVWVVDCEAGGRSHRLLRLDMRSLEMQEVPLAEADRVDRVLCTDGAGNAICSRMEEPQLWRVQPDGTTTLLAGAAEASYRDGPAAEAQFAGEFYMWAAAAGDGSIVVTDQYNYRLRLVSPDGTVSTLAGSGGAGFSDGPLAEAQFGAAMDLVLTPDGDVLVVDFDGEDNRPGLLLRTVPAGLPPPPHLVAPAPPAAPVPPASPAPVHPLVAMCDGLLQSGMLADVVIRVVGGSGAAPQRDAGQSAVQGGGGVPESVPAGEARVGSSGGGDRASLFQAGSSGDASSSACSAATVDIACHRAILAAASYHFNGKFGFVQQQQQQPPQDTAAATTSGSSDADGHKRNATDGEPASSTGAGKLPSAAALAGPPPVPVVVTVEGASVDAVHAVLRYMYK